MTIHTKGDEARSAECHRIGREIDRLSAEQLDLRNTVNDLNAKIYEAKLRAAEIQQRLDRISGEQDAIRAVAGRGGTIGGEVTAQAIALARQKDALERELQGQESEARRLETLLQPAQRRLENVDYLLDRLHAAFDQMGCGISDRTYR